LFACLIFGGNYWNNAITALNGMGKSERDEALDLFKLFASKMYGKDIALWLINNWKYVEPWHFKLIEHLRGRSV